MRHSLLLPPALFFFFTFVVALMTHCVISHHHQEDKRWIQTDSRWPNLLLFLFKTQDYAFQGYLWSTNHKASIHKASSDTLKIYTVHCVQVVVAHLFYSTVISFGFVHCQFKVRGMLQYLDRPHVLRQWASNRVLLLIWQTFYALAFCLVWIWNIKITFVFVFWPTGALFRFIVQSCGSASERPVTFVGSEIFSTDPDPDLNLAHLTQPNSVF